jgi:hypothetical protein
LEILNENINIVYDTLRNEIRKVLNPRSIILIGSFGRKEPCFIIVDDKIQFVSDCEVIVISDKKVIKDDIIKLEKHLFKMLGIDVQIYVNPPKFKFTYNMPKSIENYDLKYGSQVIYGYNPLKKLPIINPDEINIWEGIRLILNRMIESMKYIQLSQTCISGDNKVLSYWMYKTVLACQDGILLTEGKYHYSYIERNKIFKDIIANSELYDIIPNILPLSIKATEQRLYGMCITDYDIDMEDFWLDISKICNGVLRYIIKKDTGITFISYKHFPKIYLDNYSKNYYRGFSSFGPCQNLATMGKMIFIDNKIPSMTLFPSIFTPWNHKVYSLVPLLYFSLDNHKINDNKINNNKINMYNINIELLERIKHELKGFASIKLDSDNLNNWCNIKEILIGLWYDLCH